MEVAQNHRSISTCFMHYLLHSIKDGLSRTVEPPLPGTTPLTKFVPYSAHFSE